MEKQGVFYAVSVGPGDPELLTRQACRLLQDMAQYPYRVALGDFGDDQSPVHLALKCS